ncbi:MAG: ATPase, partial [Bacteroidetes bacterium 4484_276]
MIWNSIPAQLARKNRKFVYGSLKRGARSKDFEKPLTWLNVCGQIHKVNKVSNPTISINSGDESSAFKLYMVDVGLLSAMG